MAVEYNGAIVQQLARIRRHPAYDENALDAGPTRCHRAHEISQTIAIPQGTWIDPTFGFLYQERLRPRPFCTFRFNHVNTKVRIGVEDEEFSRVISDRGGPYSIS